MFHLTNQEDTDFLIYADWLEEQGRLDRAEFIRVQCGLMSPAISLKYIGCEDGGPRAKNLEREWILWNAHAREWFPLPLSWLLDRRPMTASPSCFVNRGFIQDVYCMLKEWKKFGDKIYQSNPVQEVHFYRWLSSSTLRRLGKKYKGVRFSTPDSAWGRFRRGLIRSSLVD